ncbi:2-oxoglutarate and iron-dependent oxygenase domain-containing protein CP2 isoform X2 [Cryptomeria japonica]|uniref:2-oxoglutarate and iron-dependent oxygenase domain-containing protein CP2 isoform X2 n=1 Tax=Cryptomeria japonica TaxID=3369 RepID=UPI0027DA9314|nr:2-oxoglutarate and iron-dependent oxygenase domain-containing protein CP2 isoform X2 [Cryptomeria japonica]
MTMVAEMGEKSKLVAQNANGSASAKSAHLSHEIQDEAKRTVRLRKQPNMDHKPENYDDVRTDYHPAVFSALERFLPPDSLNARREIKLQHMSDVISSYLPRGERMRAQRHCEYRERIIKYYQPRNRELYTLNPDCFFVQSFIDATKENTEESFRRIISEPSPGVYAFSMLQPGFCELLIAEVENFEKWVEITKYKIMRPNTMNKYGAVLDDFGFSPMLDKLMREFVTPMATVLFPALLGSTLDSHHGFVVEYSKDRDLELGFHVDDSEVTLNVCLGKQFTGGDLFFKGVRCDNHVNIQNFQEENVNYSHVPGQAVLHAGRHRHGALAIDSGYRINLILWCRSSLFRELKQHRTEFPDWCGECFHKKQARQRQIFDSRKQEILIQRDQV